MSKKDPIGVKPIVKLIDETNKTRHNINNNRSSLGAVSSFVSKAKDREKELSRKEDEDTVEISATEYLSHSLMKPRSWEVYSQSGTTFLTNAPLPILNGTVPKGQVLVVDKLMVTVGWLDLSVSPTNQLLSNFLSDSSLRYTDFTFNLKSERSLYGANNLLFTLFSTVRSSGFNVLNKNVLSSEPTSKALYITENLEYVLDYSLSFDPATDLDNPTVTGQWVISAEIGGYFITNQEYEKILKLTS